VTGPDGARELDRDVELAAEAHQRLLGALDDLVAREALDVSAPSRLPGWTKGHVITHVTNSGDGHALILEAAAAGRVGHQYPHGAEGRAADIEAGAARPPADQVDDLRRSIWRLEGLWATSSWEGHGVGPLGHEMPVRDLPFLRLREVAIHHVDLDIGYELTDLPDTYVRLELRRMEMLWRARQPMGLTALPELARVQPPPERLAWLMGRRSIDGLPPADVF
jgi:maleylpyruvate isomerase